MICTSASSSHIAIHPNPSALALQADVSAATVSDHDQRLVSAAQSGCEAAFSELFSLYSRRIYRTVFAITKNAADAEDALQDSFLRAFVAINRFEGRSSFYSWLTRIAINSALMGLRRRRARPESSIDIASDVDGEIAPWEIRDSAPDPEQVYCQGQRSAKLVRAIQRLAPDLREVVRARLEEECSVKELAVKFNISEAAAKSRLYRARMRLSGFPRIRKESSQNLAFSGMRISN